MSVIQEYLASPGHVVDLPPIAPLDAPFSEEDGLFHGIAQNSRAHHQQDAIDPSTGPAYLTLPASYISPKQELLRIDSTSPKSLVAFLKNEADVSQLNKIDKHLWMAGLERPTRALHQQIALGREIIVTEQAAYHMLWEGSRIYIKPLPDFILCHSMWKNYICKEKELFEQVCGFLLSYIWLIGRKSDLRIAHERGLISRSISWEQWVSFVSAVLKRLDCQTLANINIRYRRGELRISRINWIYRLCSRTRNPTTFFRGFLYGYRNYGTFVERNLAWLASAAIYTVLVLTAMQVGLATDRLGHSVAFQRASYGFTVLSIVSPLIVVAGLFALILMLIVFNLRYTLNARKTWDYPAIDNYKH